MNPNEDPQTLEQRSESIRADVGETLEALQRNYSPGALVDRSMNLLRDHGGDMATTILQAVRRNPMPVMLMGAGVAWMIAAQLRSGSEDEGTAYETGSFGEEAQRSDDGPDTDETSGNGVGERFDDAREKLRSAASAATGKVSQGARKLGARVRGVAEGAGEQSRRAGAQMSRLLQEQPFMVGAAGVAIGALIGSLLPESAQEDRLLGPARDRVLKKARSAGEKGAESVRRKLHEAVERPADAARDGGPRDEGELAGAGLGGTPA